MLDVFHMHTNLMCAPRVQFALDEREAIVFIGRLKTLQYLKRGYRRTRLGLIGNLHTSTDFIAAENWRIDKTRITGNVPMHQTQIAPIDVARADLILQFKSDFIVFGNKHKS